MATNQYKASNIVAHIRENDFFLLFLDKLGKTLQTKQVKTFKEIRLLVRNTPMFILIPSKYVFITHIKIPKTRKKENTTAAAFLLEEKLMTPINNNIMSMGKHHHDTCSVAIINQNLLARYKNNLLTHHLTPKAIMPDFLLLPYEKNCWSMAINQNRALLRTGKAAGLSITLHNLPLIIEQKIKKNQKIKKIYLWGTPSNELLTFLKIQFQSIIRKQAFPYVNINILVQEPIFNFTHYHYFTKITTAFNQKTWILPCILLTLCLLFSLTKKMSTYMSLRHQYQQLEHNIQRILQQISPGSTDNKQTSAMINKTIHHLLNQQKEQPCIHMISNIANILNQEPLIRLDNIVYDNKQLHLILKTKEKESFERLLKNIGKQEWHLKNQNIYQKNNYNILDITMG